MMTKNETTILKLLLSDKKIKAFILNKDLDKNGYIVVEDTSYEVESETIKKLFSIDDLTGFKSINNDLSFKKVDKDYDENNLFEELLFKFK
jgi:hypothetical protein